ncbi:MAG: GntR family transcriptional regulator [Oscillospiraceae bacterium]|nr:GntR family transcriptional regulator [Oscillospiraceae bacterium]
MEPIKPVKLWTRAYEALLQEIQSMEPGENRLPPEDEIAAALQVSRATVREAMHVLIAEGYVTRRQGKGIFAHPSALALKQRIDFNTDFITLLSNGEEQAVCRFLSSGYAAASPVMKARFPEPCDQVYQQHWLYCRGEKPLISCHISVPQARLIKAPQLPRPNQNLLRWILEYCHAEISYCATHLLCSANEEAAQVLRLSDHCAMINWHEILFDLSDRPTAFCNVFFHPEEVDLSMILPVNTKAQYSQRVGKASPDKPHDLGGETR